MPTLMKFLIGFLFSLLLLSGILISWNPQDNSQYYEDAPDGNYEVLLGWRQADYENSIVSFVMCGSSGSELHGDFKFKEGLIFPSDYWGYLTVKLQNNIVVEIVDA